MVVNVSDLSKRLQQANGDHSIDWIVDRARARGHKIHRSVVAKYVRGNHGPKPPEETLAPLAAGLGLHPREFRELAGRPAGELGQWEPPAESASLTQDERDALDQLIRAMTKGGGRHGAEGAAPIGGDDGGSGGAEVTEFPTRPGTSRYAARRAPKQADQQQDE